MTPGDTQVAGTVTFPDIGMIWLEVTLAKIGHTGAKTTIVWIVWSSWLLLPTALGSWQPEVSVRVVFIVGLGQCDMRQVTRRQLGWFAVRARAVIVTPGGGRSTPGQGVGVFFRNWHPWPLKDAGQIRCALAFGDCEWQLGFEHIEGDDVDDHDPARAVQKV